MGFTYGEFTQILDKHLREEQIERVLEALAKSPQPSQEFSDHLHHARSSSSMSYSLAG